MIVEAPNWIYTSKADEVTNLFLRYEVHCKKTLQRKR